jgi:hypothetical protein
MNDQAFDARWDMEGTMTVSPVKAKAGFLLTITCPTKRTRVHPIPPGTTKSLRVCVKGGSTQRRPDGTMGNYWVTINIPEVGTDDSQPEGKPPAA